MINTFARVEDNPMNRNPKKRTREDAFGEPLDGAQQIGLSISINRAPSMFICTCYDPDAELGAKVQVPAGMELKEHRKRCHKMSEKYGTLYDEWQSIADEAIVKDNIEEWRNMRAFYEHFRMRFIDGLELNREAAKRRRMNEDAEEEVNEDLTEPIIAHPLVKQPSIP